MEDSKQEEKIEKAIIGLSEAMYSLIDVFEEQERKRKQEKEEWSKVWAISGGTVFVLMLVALVVVWLVT